MSERRGGCLLLNKLFSDLGIYYFAGQKRAKVAAAEILVCIPGGEEFVRPTVCPAALIGRAASLFMLCEMTCGVGGRASERASERAVVLVFALTKSISL